MIDEKTCIIIGSLSSAVDNMALIIDEQTEKIKQLESLIACLRSNNSIGISKAAQAQMAKEEKSK